MIELEDVPQLQDQPTPAFIAEMERRYPVEAEINKCLVRKMRRRANGPFARASLAELQQYFSAFLRDNVTPDFQLENARWLNGGASKLQAAFELTWQAPDVGRRQETVVLRMEPAESLNSNSRRREFELLRAFHGVLPVPEVFFLDEHGDWFPEPTLVYAFAPGVTKPTATTTGKMVGLGTNFGPALRERLAPQFVGYLAKIHRFDHRSANFTSMDVPALGTGQAALWQLNRARRVWEEDTGERIPLMTVAANWLERNAPPLDLLSVIHGDYRSGNFMFDEAGGNITAWLDWERGHLGDRHRDLAWTTQTALGHYNEDGSIHYVCGIVPEDDFYRMYEAGSGLSVDRARLDYYRILNAYQIVVGTLASAYRLARLGKTHQDVLLARLRALPPVFLRDLANLLAKKL
jgi:aminoglycoside phosphotransferase (APT) family kinase protein